MALLSPLLRALQGASRVLAEMHSHLEAGVGKKSFPKAFRFQEEFISFCLYDPGPWLFVSYQLEVTLRSCSFQRFCFTGFSNIVTYFRKPTRRVTCWFAELDYDIMYCSYRSYIPVLLLSFTNQQQVTGPTYTPKEGSTQIIKHKEVRRCHTRACPLKYLCRKSNMLCSVPSKVQE